MSTRWSAIAWRVRLPLVWQAETFPQPAAARLYEEGCSHGMRAGVTFPIHGPNGEFGMLSFACDRDAGRGVSRATVTALLPELALVRDYAFASGVRFCPPVDARSRAAS